VTLPTRISARGSSLALDAVLVDIGLEGACVEVGMPVEAGDRVRLSVDLPGLWDPLLLDAIVAWTAAGPEQRARAGVQFTSPPGASLLLLAELVGRT
jgi:hypothetical protein